MNQTRLYSRNNKTDADYHYFYDMVYGKNFKEGNANSKDASGEIVYSRDYKVTLGRSLNINFKFNKTTLEYKTCDYARGQLLLVDLNGSNVKTTPVLGKLTKNFFGIYDSPTSTQFINLYNLKNILEVFIYFIPNLDCFEIAVKKYKKVENQIFCTSNIEERNNWINMFYKFSQCDQKPEKQDISNNFFVLENYLNGINK